MRRPKQQDEITSLAQFCTGHCAVCEGLLHSQWHDPKTTVGCNAAATPGQPARPRRPGTGVGPHRGLPWWLMALTECCGCTPATCMRDPVDDRRAFPTQVFPRPQ